MLRYYFILDTFHPDTLYAICMMYIIMTKKITVYCVNPLEDGNAKCETNGG
jgi:hypothetical protein